MDEKIAILTDTNSGITPDQAAWYGIYLVAMPVIIDDETYFENESICQEEFFQRLREGASVSTSQPAPGILMDCWDSLLEHYDQVISLPMSSGLSGSCHTAAMLAEESLCRKAGICAFKAVASQRNKYWSQCPRSQKRPTETPS